MTEFSGRLLQPRIAIALIFPVIAIVPKHIAVTQRADEGADFLTDSVLIASRE